jgi:hypothetical protein
MWTRHAKNFLEVLIMSQNSGFSQFTMGENDQAIGGGKSKRWKGETGRNYRFSILWFPNLETGTVDLGTPEKPNNPLFVGAPISYIPGVGFVVNNGPEITKLAGGEPPGTKVATIIAVWPLKKDGSPDGASIQAGNTDVASWVFGGKKYQTLVQINREFPLALHDLTVKCDDAQYQKLTFSPCRESLLHKFLDLGEKAKAWMDPLMAEASHLVPNIQGELGRVMTVEQIRAKLVGGPAATGEGHFGAAAGPVSGITGDLDNLVDNLLDT